jgi:dynein heavy chain 1
MLTDIKTGRGTFDNSQTEQHFGAIVVDYRLVQVKINNKYDLWHKELLMYFGSTFGDKLRAFHKKITDERMKLQKINFQNLSSDLMEAIMTM